VLYQNIHFSMSEQYDEEVDWVKETIHSNEYESLEKKASKDRFIHPRRMDRGGTRKRDSYRWVALAESAKFLSTISANIPSAITPSRPRITQTRSIDDVGPRQ
jgi:hypothetical protein